MSSKPFEEVFFRISKLWAGLGQGSAALQGGLQKPELYSHRNRHTKNAQKLVDARFGQRNKLFGPVTKTKKRDRLAETNNDRWQHTWSLQLCFLDVVVELEAWGIPVTWLLMPTLTSVKKCHGLRQAGLRSFWAAPPASAPRWPTVTERAMHGQGLLGQAQWGSPQVVQWGDSLALGILKQVNSYIKVVLCANRGILFDLH